MRIEYLQPLDAGYRHMKRVLFKNSGVEKWLKIGFAAWIAGLAGFVQVGSTFGDADPVPSLAGAQSFIEEQSIWVWAGLLVVFLSLTAVLIVLSWVRSRGKFVFVDNVTSNVGRIRQPWREYRSEGNSLFFGMLGLALIHLALGVVCGLVGFVGFRMGLEDALSVALVAVPIAFFVSGSLVLVLVTFFTDSFVVPMMFSARISFREAWGRFSKTLAQYPGHFLLYVLFTVILGIGIGLLTLVAVLMTCCVLALVLAVPYVGAVVLLPVPVFWRAFSIFYLQQMIPELGLLATPDPIAPPVDPPPLENSSA